jgi:tetratricopeptide (TPR) repeat protein
MTRLGQWIAGLVVLIAICKVSNGTAVFDSAIDTTSGVIAIANLDQQISQLRDETGVEELLLVRSRFLADYEALDRASSLTEIRFEAPADLLRRARTRSALHRFADALADVAAAEHAGSNGDEIVALRSSILVATGRAAEAIPQLEANLVRHPGFASRSALAVAYAAIGRLGDADRLYVAALADLDTTLPFPYAWIYFARGVMWAEQGGDQARAEAMYVQALAYLPQFVSANLHLAELEVARGDLTSAIERLDRIVRSSDEPEALALLGGLHARIGDTVRGEREVALARERYESLLAHDLLAFADHAAEFYLGPGADAVRAWDLAQKNLANRETDRAAALAVRAAEATGRYPDACALLLKYGSNSGGSLEMYLRSLDRQLAQLTSVTR